jgi:hypothetical protein
MDVGLTERLAVRAERAAAYQAQRGDSASDGYHQASQQHDRHQCDSLAHVFYCAWSSAVPC